MSWIQTYTGRKFYPLSPKAEDVSILDIAHALSLSCRFKGHCREFYSVAEHSVRLADWMGGRGASPALQLCGLLHDGAEAYLADLPTPVKELMPSYREAERRVLLEIGIAFGLSFSVCEDAIHLADLVMLATEARDLLGPPPEPWRPMPDPIPTTIVPWGPKEAEELFLARFYQLSKQDGKR
jgi:hypothetical protein